jgi:hypothetical protein
MMLTGGIESDDGREYFSGIGARVSALAGELAGADAAVLGVFSRQAPA